MPDVTEALARAAEKLTGHRIALRPTIPCIAEHVPPAHLDRRGSRLAARNPARLWAIREGRSWRLIPPVQSDPGWWLRALWKAGYRVTLDPEDTVAPRYATIQKVPIVLPEDGGARYEGYADDPLNALAAALTDMGGAGRE